MTIIFYNCDNTAYAVNGAIEAFAEKAIDQNTCVTYNVIKRWVKIVFPAGVILSKNNIEILSQLLQPYDYEIYTEAVID